jgi:5-methylcytosine-specific restriction endonuclease McrA
MSDPRPAARIRDQYVMHLFRLNHLGEPCDLCERRPGTDPHHKVFRSQGGNDDATNLLWLCRPCHDDIHAGRTSRYAIG